MLHNNPYTLEQYSGAKIRSPFTERRLKLGYTYTTLSTITHIKPNRLIKIAGLNANARPEEVEALAKALIVSPTILEGWIICTSAPHNPN